MTPLEKMLVEHECPVVPTSIETPPPLLVRQLVSVDICPASVYGMRPKLYSSPRVISTPFGPSWIMRSWHWHQLDDVRADVVLSMAFNLCVSGFLRFIETQVLIEEQSWDRASLEMLWS